MVKRCQVVLNNDAVTVFRLDDIDIQVPAIKRKAEYVNVLYSDGRYVVVDDDYKEESKSISSPSHTEQSTSTYKEVRTNRRRNKKTTNRNAYVRDNTNR